MTPVVAFLMLDGRARQTCVGCTEILAEQGMVVKVLEYVLNAQQPEYSVIMYEIAPGFTLAECQAAIRARHVGPPWGH
jgi:hypothetical protein